MLQLTSIREPVRPAFLKDVPSWSRQTSWSSQVKLSPVSFHWPRGGSALRESVEATPIWQEIGSSIVRVSQSDLQLLERLYTFRKRAEVIWYLERFPFLVPLLLEAYDTIADYFPGSPVFLDFVADPEATEDDQLVAFIATDFSPDEALDRLDQFDDGWWLAALERAEGKLCIHVELR